MHQAEYDALSQPLTNAARVLYYLCLRPSADPLTQLTKPLNYKNLSTVLNGKESTDSERAKFTRGRQINSLLQELMSVDLVELPDQTSITSSLNGKQLTLPKIANLHSKQLSTSHTSAMSIDWQPNQALLTDLLSLMGIIDKTLHEEELGEFIAYWMGRPDTHLTPYQWTHKLAQQMKRKRLASGMMSVKRVGTQLVDNDAGLEADENAKRLVEKYEKYAQDKMRKE